MSQPDAIAIVGATASGKTSLALEVARLLGGEIVSMDSRQLYRGMEIGTAKPTAAQRAAVPHRGLDLAQPGERFGAGRFARMARAEIAAIRGRGGVPMLVGGTGFFLRALTHPIFREPELDPRRRAALLSFLEGLDTPTLHHWLGRLDAESAERLTGWGGRQRLIRALELPLLTGRPLSWWHRSAPAEAEPLRAMVFVLDAPRDQLVAAIDRRVDVMMSAGLVDEVRGLLERGFLPTDPGMKTTGYMELIPALRGEVSIPEAVEQIKRNTRAYARRQLTWFRHQLPEGAVWLDASRSHPELAEEIATAWRKGEA